MNVLSQHSFKSLWIQKNANWVSRGRTGMLNWKRNKTTNGRFMLFRISDVSFLGKKFTSWPSFFVKTLRTSHNCEFPYFSHPNDFLTEGNITQIPSWYFSRKIMQHAKTIFHTHCQPSECFLSLWYSKKNRYGILPHPSINIAAYKKTLIWFKPWGML